MAEKQIKISSDGGSTFNTFPGSSGEYGMERESLDDSTYGFSFKSTRPGLGTWSMSTNAFYKGYSGYEAKILKSGTSTTATGGGMTQVGATSVWATTLTSTNMWNRLGATVVVYDGVVDVTADVASIDYIWGRVTFTTGSEPVGVVTADFDYFPTSQYCVAREFTLTQSADTQDTTDFCSAQTNKYRSFKPTTRTVSLSLSGFYALNNGFKLLVESSDELIIEISPAGLETESACRGIFRALTTGSSGDFGGAEDESVDFQLSVPDSTTVPFSWVHPDTTTIPVAIHDGLEAWQDEATYKYQYLPDGLAGEQGDGIITDISLSAGLSAMPEYSVSIQGSGARTVVV